MVPAAKAVLPSLCILSVFLTFPATTAWGLLCVLSHTGDSGSFLTHLPGGFAAQPRDTVPHPGVKELLIPTPNCKSVSLPEPKTRPLNCRPFQLTWPLLDVLKKALKTPLV